MNTKFLYLTTTLFIAASTVACAAEHAPHWGYEGENGPEKWSKLSGDFKSCEEGKAQSPINVVGNVDADLPEMSFFYRPVSPQVINNGHTIQVNMPEGMAMTVGADLYNLVQVHFHTPSENQINGKSYPLEAHFVHKRADGSLGVVGVMFEEGAANPELAKIWEKMPKKADEKAEFGDTKLDLTQLLPQDHRYYRFMGSLTTPPCSEGVNWHIMQQPVTASAEQIAAFKELYKLDARPLQPTNSRLIVKDTK